MKKTKEEICSECGYRKYEHKFQQSIALDRIESRKYGAPCVSFKEK